MHVVQIWIMHINALKTQLMHKNVQTNPKKSKIHTTLLLYYVDTRKNLKAIRGNGYRFVPDVPYRKPSCLLWEALVCEKHIPKPAQMGQKFYHDILMPLHDSMPSFMNFRRVLDLLEFRNQVCQCFAGNQRWPGVWNSFPFLAWDLSMHPRTKIWFFNQFICTGAFACSSNLNYAHKCIENTINA